MSRTNKTERFALALMVVAVVVSLLAAAQGYVGLGFLLFLSAATPLPLLASIRARRAREAHPGPREDGAGRYDAPKSQSSTARTEL